jgi:recombinational DNA repair ATPase RecF
MLTEDEPIYVLNWAVFAIQKCDPAPFYLFDEIDANLDPDRRTSVAGNYLQISLFRSTMLTRLNNANSIHLFF